jgi:selenium-binding protein 1
MKVRGRSKVFHSIRRGIRTASAAVLVLSIGLSYGTVVRADETCLSPYMAKITGSEDFVYVWTLGAEGIGDESDKLVTIDVREGSKTYGKVIHSASVGGRHEAHHAGLTDDRRYLWAEARWGLIPFTPFPAGC